MNIPIFLKKQPIWLLILLSLVIFFTVDTNYLAFDNITNILNGSAVYGVIAIGMTFLLINGQIDLSVGSIAGLSTALVIGLQSHGIWLAIIVTLLVGAIIGALNGFFVSKLSMNAFIVTLAMMIAIKGVTFTYSKEQTLLGDNIAFSDFGMQYVWNIPLIVLIVIALYILAHYVLKHTAHGRNTYAVGGNKEASIHAGINANKNIFINFVISGVTAAIGGILLGSQLNAAPPTLGSNFEMFVITAVVIGGTKLSGGFGGIMQTAGGILLIAMVQNGLNYLNWSSDYYVLITGLMLILAIYLDRKNGDFIKSIKL